MMRCRHGVWTVCATLALGASSCREAAPPPPGRTQQWRAKQVAVLGGFDVPEAVVINLLASISPEIESVRAICKWRGKIRKLFSGSHILSDVHIVLCVRQHANISNIRESIIGGPNETGH